MISVILPTRNAEASLAGTLGLLVPGVVEGLIRDVVIVDDGSEDATLEIADATGCRIVSGGANLSAGVEAAQGDWLLLLEADASVNDGWMDGLRRHMKLYPLQAGYFRLGFDAPGLVWGMRVEAAAITARLVAPEATQGLFLSRALYEAVISADSAAGQSVGALIGALGKARIRALHAGLSVPAARFSDRHVIVDGLRHAGAQALAWLGIPQAPKRKT